MDRRTEETDYVLESLRRARQEIIAHPEWFDPDALERIDRAIACIQEAKLEVQAA
jgi:hypothetical protein